MPCPIGPDGPTAFPNLIHCGVVGADVECSRPDLVTTAGKSEESKDKLEEFDGPEVCRLHDSAEYVRLCPGCEGISLLIRVPRNWRARKDRGGSR
jgi:hypothetical protein